MPLIWYDYGCDTASGSCDWSDWYGCNTGTTGNIIYYPTNRYHTGSVTSFNVTIRLNEPVIYTANVTTPISYLNSYLKLIGSSTGWISNAWNSVLGRSHHQTDLEAEFARERAETQQNIRATAEAMRPLWEEAQKKAQKLLRSCLDDHQCQQLDQRGYFEVISKDGTKRYAIYNGRAGNVYLLDKDGKAVKKFCCHPIIACPDGDTMLSQMLQLRNDPASFERLANVHPMDTRGHRHHELRLVG